MKRRPQPGTYGVLGIFGWVILWDVFGPQEITDVVRSWWHHPVKRFPTGAMICITALHLLGYCPRAIDPWHQVGRLRPSSLSRGRR